MNLRLWPLLAALALAALHFPALAETRIAGAAQPQLAAASDGRVWLVYGQGHDVAVARSDDSGNTFLPPSTVATLPQLMLGMRRGPRIVARGDTITVTVVAPELLAYRSTDAGRTWIGPVTVNDVAECTREGLHDLALSPNGELFATWLDLRNGKMELWGASSRDGGATWAKNQQVYKSPGVSICECCHPTALFDADGNLAVMWRNSIDGSRDMWMTTRAKGATQFAAAHKVGQGTWQLNACPMDGGRIVALGGGKFGAIFQRAGEVFYVSDTGAEISLGKGKQPIAMLEDREPLLLWQDGSDLVSVKGSGHAPTKRATDARFAVVALMPGARGILLAYEQGSAKEKQPGIVVERL